MLTPESASEAGLRHQTVLVFPRIEITPRNWDSEHRFCGNRGICKSGIYPEMDKVLNAFMHYSFEESGRRMVFADLQGIS